MWNCFKFRLTYFIKKAMRGISTIIVTVLLVIIVVAIVGLAYTFLVALYTTSAGAAQNATNVTITSALSQIRIESIFQNRVIVRNVGTIEVSDFKVFINDVSNDFTTDKTTIKPNEIATMTITNPSTSGILKIITEQGAIATSNFIAPPPPPPIDTLSPVWFNNLTFPASPNIYSPLTSYQFNVTWQDDFAISGVFIENNFTGSSIPHNDTVATFGGNAYYFNLGSLAAGLYVWKEYANDTTNNWNSTGNYWNYIINKASSTTNLFINETREEKTFNINTVTNFTAQLINPLSGNVELWTNFSDGIYKLWTGGTSPLINLTSMQSIGRWIWTANFSENQNYTGSTETWFVNVVNLTNKTCSSTWGFSCDGVAPDSDNTFDTCPTSSSANDEHVIEVYVNATTVTANDWIEAKCGMDPFSISNEHYIWYYNTTAWRMLLSGNSPGSANYNLSTVFRLNNTPGTHWIRCIIDWDGENDFCADLGSFFDNDDVNITVI